MHVQCQAVRQNGWDDVVTVAVLLQHNISTYIHGVSTRMYVYHYQLVVCMYVCSTWIKKIPYNYPPLRGLCSLFDVHQLHSRLSRSLNIHTNIQAYIHAYKHTNINTHGFGLLVAAFNSAIRYIYIQYIHTNIHTHNTYGYGLSAGTFNSASMFERKQINLTTINSSTIFMCHYQHGRPHQKRGDLIQLQAF